MARRLNGEGNIRHRADGRWECRVMDGYLDDGRRNIQTFYGRTQKEVREKLKEFLEARASGIDTRQRYTFGGWADVWYEHHRDNITPTTQESYRYTLRILKEYFGPRRLGDIKPYDVELFLRTLRKEGRSDSYLAQCRGMLYQIFRKAEANDLVRKEYGHAMVRSRRRVRRKNRRLSERDDMTAAPLLSDKQIDTA